MKSFLRTEFFSRLLQSLAVLCAFLNFTALAQLTVLNIATNPANGHIYYLLQASDWTNSENAAVGLGGHLATVRNQGEDNWINSTFGATGQLWIGLYDPISGDGSGTEHAADFI
jgi:hypothetical protein